MPIPCQVFGGAFVVSPSFSQQSCHALQGTMNHENGPAIFNTVGSGSRDTWGHNGALISGRHFWKKICLTSLSPDDSSLSTSEITAIEVELAGRGCNSLTGAPL